MASIEWSKPFIIFSSIFHRSCEYYIHIDIQDRSFWPKFSNRYVNCSFMIDKYCISFKSMTKILILFGYIICVLFRSGFNNTPAQPAAISNYISENSITISEPFIRRVWVWTPISGGVGRLTHSHRYYIETIGMGRKWYKLSISYD